MTRDADSILECELANEVLDELAVDLFNQYEAEERNGFVLEINE